MATLITVHCTLATDVSADWTFDADRPTTTVTPTNNGSTMTVTAAGVDPTSGIAPGTTYNFVISNTQYTPNGSAQLPDGAASGIATTCAAPPTAVTLPCKLNVQSSVVTIVTNYSYPNYYFYSMVAQDAAGNLGQWSPSNSVTVTPPLVVQCSPSPNTAILNQAVFWRADVAGGNGIYTYVWTGSDGFSSTTINSASAFNIVQTSYSTIGSKSASVIVSSGTATSSPTDCFSSVNVSAPPFIQTEGDIHSNTNIRSSN